MNIICMVTFWLMTETRIHQPLGRMDQSTDKKSTTVRGFLDRNLF